MRASLLSPALGLCLALMLLAGFAHATQDRVSGIMMPLPQELLRKPIALSGKCQGVVVREWRVGVRGSQVTPAAIRLMDSICKRDVETFDTFIERYQFARRTRRRSPGTCPCCPTETAAGA